MGDDMKKLTIFEILAIILLILNLFLFINYKNMLSQKLQKTENSSSIEVVLTENLPLKSIKMNVLNEKNYIIQGIATKSSILSFIDDATYEKLKFLFLILPEEFNIELNIENQSDFESFNFIVKSIEINNLKVNTNIQLKI